MCVCVCVYPNIKAPENIINKPKNYCVADSNTITVGGFNSPLTSVGRSSRQKVNKERAALSDLLDQMNFINLYTLFHPNVAECTLFLSAHGTFSRRDHMFGHETSLN